MNAVITLFGWCLLAVVSAMRFSGQPAFSASERARLVEQGDSKAKEEQEWLDAAPLLVSLQFVVRTLLISAFITYCVVAYGTVSGILIGTATVLCLPLAFRFSFVGAWADTLRDTAMPWLKKTVFALKPFLKWLRERDVVVNEATLHSQEELLDLLERSPDILSREEQERLVASLAFDHKKVADIMTPRSMISGVPLGETLGPLVLDELYKTGYSRFPVFDGDLDHIVGMLYLHDLLDLRRGSQPAKKAMQTKVHFVRQDKNLTHVLHGFLKTRHHLFIVVNEYRETVGLLSLEDVLEALLGSKIVDEFDAFDDLRAVAEHNPKSNNEPEGKEDI